MDPSNAKNRLVFATVLDAGNVYSDQTGCFPFISIRVFNYLFIIFLYDVNAMFSDPFKIRIGKDILQVYTTFHYYLKDRVFKTKLYWLGNEASYVLNEYNQNQVVELQLVPTGANRINTL